MVNFCLIPIKRQRWRFISLILPHTLPADRVTERWRQGLWLCSANSAQSGSNPGSSVMICSYATISSISSISSRGAPGRQNLLYSPLEETPSPLFLGKMTNFFPQTIFIPPLSRIGQFSSGNPLNSPLFSLEISSFSQIIISSIEEISQ